MAGVMIRLAKNCVTVCFSMCNFWVKCVLPHSTNNRQPVIAVAVALVAVVVVFVAARLTVVVVMAFSVGGIAIALVAGIAVVIVVTAAAVTIVRTIQANSIFQCFSLTL